jgi:hypothetical protein
MMPVDYEELAGKCLQEAESMLPCPERDELLKNAKLFQSYAKMDKWIAVPGVRSRRKLPMPGRDRSSD